MKAARRLGILVAAIAAAGPSSARAASPPNPWRLVAAAPPQSIYGDTLLGVSAAGKSSAWAVGNNGHGVLIEHWNGSRWKTQVSASSDADASLASVAAINSRDVWAVGESRRGGALVYRYNGSRWRVMENLPSGMGKLFAVSASAPDNVWVSNEATDLWRWDGSSWTLMYTGSNEPIGGGGALDVISPTDVWATADHFNQNLDFFPQALHWDGAKVTVEALPNPNAGPSTVNRTSGIATDPSGGAWVSGVSTGKAGSPYGARRRPGSAWVFSAPSGAGLPLAATDAIAAQRSNDVWAVGDYEVPTGEEPEHVFLGHWNGMTWQRFVGPNPGAGQDTLRAVAAIPGTDDFWAVGFYLGNNSGLAHGLILHCCS